MSNAPTPAPLERRIGVGAAVMLGLGSIMGTGVFVSLGLGAGIAGSGVVFAILLAGGLAACNGLSSAQLAAAHPVAGGTYEYGYIYLTPALGFTAGWMFLAAKSASAATAALGFAGYLLNALAVAAPGGLVPVALVVVAALTVLVLTGIKRTSTVNILVVTITLAALAAVVVAGLVMADLHLPAWEASDAQADRAGWKPGASALLHATALMFVAYTGYGRIATMGEEIRDPARNIPRAIIVTLIVSAIVYVAVALVALAAVGAAAFFDATEQQAAPLEVIARTFGEGGTVTLVVAIVSIGALTAMLGVLLNLILGLSRVALAMGRRRDLPGSVGGLTTAGTPLVAIILVAVIIALLTMLGSVKAAWSFSAFTVLVYYGLTNLAALRLPSQHRLYPRAFAWLGLVGCIGLAFFVEPLYWGAGLALIAAGLAWHVVARRVAHSPGHAR
ncbi:MAG: APC family permease [Phycisphaeraceae bacterium]